MFALAKWGAGAKPLQKKRCHSEARPQTAWRPKNLALTELFLGQRGACTVEFDVNNRIIIVK